MTTYIYYDDVIAVLNAEWNETVIAKPTFINWSPINPNQRIISQEKIFILFFGANADYLTTGSDARDNIYTTWRMHLVHTTKAYVDLYLGEVRRILNKYDLTNGTWHVDSWKLDDQTKLKDWVCECSETLADLS